MSDNVEAMIDKWLADANASPDQSATSDTPDTGTPDAPPTPDTQPQEGQPQEPQQAATPQPQEQQPAQPTKPADSKERPTDKTQQQRQPGDLVDAQGRVIAKAGAERRHYEAAQRATRDLSTVRQELQQTQAQLQAFREAAQLPTQLGLTPEESASGLQLAAAWKANPVSTIQYLVEQAKAAGHNVDGVGGNTDMGAIRAMIANELAPFRQQAQQSQQAIQAQTAARQEIDSLVAEFGEGAMVNAEPLARILNAAAENGRQMTLEQAYFRFSTWCRERGFDPHQPIDPQMAAAQQQPQSPATPQQRLPPRPNGRPASVQPVTGIDPSGQLTGNESTRDVVRAAMREAGLNV